MTTPNTCLTCKYYVGTAPDDGECHLYPPQGKQQGRQVVPVWSPVAPTDWCGQWAPVGV